MKVSPLKDVLIYRHLDLIESFMEKYAVSESEAQEILQETLKLLWLMAMQKEEASVDAITAPAQINVYPQMNILDEMWHSFILFSQDYSKFCRRYFGRHLHHLPTTPSDRRKEKAAREANPISHEQRHTKEIEVQCRYICEKLGVETLTKWFKLLPARYSSLKLPGEQSPSLI